MLPSAISGPKLLISPDGKYLVSLAELRAKSVLTMWAPQSRTRLWQHQENAKHQYPLAFAPDVQTLAVATDESVFGRSSIAIYIVETATGKRRHLVKTLWQSDVQSAAFLSAHELVVATSRGAVVADTQTGKAIRQWNFKLPMLASDELPPPPQSYVSADGATVLALTNGAVETAVAIYDANTAKQRATWTFKGVFRNPKLSPDGTLWAMQPNNVGLFDVYDAVTGKKLRQFAGDNTSQLWSWSADSQRILSSPGAFMALSDARTGRDLGQVTGTRNAQALALDPRGDYFYTLDDKGKVWLWRMR